MGKIIANNGTTTQSRDFTISTPLGKLRVYAKDAVDCSEDFPGVYVDINGTLVACIEYGSVDGDLLATIYDGADEPCVIHHYENLAGN